MFAALPATSTYQLNSYGFGSGGTAGSSTSNYSLEGSSGEISGQTSTTSNYNIKPGFNETQQANVPKISSFTNGSNTFYNKLHFIIDEQGNPADAKYALQISTSSDFSSNVNYVKSDLTIGSSLSLSDYQTFATWGGGTGSDVIGLSSSTTYYLRAKATQGEYTESAWGPSVSVATVSPALSFSLTPSTVNMGTLTAGTVVDAPSTIDVTFATNAANGGDVYIRGNNGGLYSTSRSHTITSSSGDLSSLSNGFGARITSSGQTTGGPFSKSSPYDGTNNNVGIADTQLRKIFTSSGPITGGTGSITVKAKASINDPAASDYSEILTLIAAASY